ncbi:MAG: hypothetical protein AAGU21_06410 [Solidesulfovibrio sp.]|uniref:hypothetical protein n=1 Tax=Solidesulfovibrio sp. TaxID=2910990 RepID=UPI0031595773
MAFACTRTDGSRAPGRRLRAVIRDRIEAITPSIRVVWRSVAEPLFICNAHIPITVIQYCVLLYLEDQGGVHDKGRK